MNLPLGVGAALAATCIWAFSTILWRHYLKEAGALACTFFKTVVGGGLSWITVAALLALDNLGPIDGTGVLILALSGLVGMAAGDVLFFASMKRTGPRQATFLHSTSPLFLLLITAAFGTERLGPLQIGGVLAVVLGVFDVTRLQRRFSDTPRRDMLTGVLYGLGAAVCQAVGIVLTREAGPQGHFIFAGAVRLSGAALGIGVISLLAADRMALPRVILEPRAWRLAFLPVFLGTYLGIALMMVSILNAGAAVSGTLLSLTPITIIPISTWMLREPFNLRLLPGMLLALSGVAALSLG